MEEEGGLVGAGGVRVCLHVIELLHTHNSDSDHILLCILIRMAVMLSMPTSLWGVALND